MGQEIEQDAIGFFQSVGSGSAEGLDQAILEGAEEAFDAALGLGREGWNPGRTPGRCESDVEFVHQAAELAAWGRSSQFLGQGGLLGALEDGVLVGVEGQGQAVGLADLA